MIIGFKFFYLFYCVVISIWRGESKREMPNAREIEYYPPLARESHPHALSLKKKQLLFEEKMAL